MRNRIILAAMAAVAAIAVAWSMFVLAKPKIADKGEPTEASASISPHDITVKHKDSSKALALLFDFGVQRTRLTRRSSERLNPTRAVANVREIAAHRCAAPPVWTTSKAARSGPIAHG